jgi:hypothetical protein
MTRLFHLTFSQTDPPNESITKNKASLPTKKGSQARGEQQPFVMKKMRNDSSIDGVDFLNGEILIDR